MGLLNDLPHATCAARLAAAKTQYQKIILRRRGPLSLHNSRGLFCTGALEAAAMQDFGDRAKVHQLRGGKKNKKHHASSLS